MAQPITAQNPSYQTGQDSTVRGQFIQNGQLTNGQDENFRAISDDFPVFGISVDLGSIQSTTSPIVWAVGYVRDPSINYTTGKGETQLRSPYYATQYSTIDDVVSMVSVHILMIFCFDESTVIDRRFSNGL